MGLNPIVRGVEDAGCRLLGQGEKHDALFSLPPESRILGECLGNN
jgi:hypothetical protein